ncbi:Uncharacterised protein [Legionella oakridgensis]|nr:Uncharacterised protein [Legionella oakridgensis]
MPRYGICLYFFMKFSESGNFQSCSDVFGGQIQSKPDLGQAMPPILRIGSNSYEAYHSIFLFLLLDLESIETLIHWLVFVLLL